MNPIELITSLSLLLYVSIRENELLEYKSTLNLERGLCSIIIPLYNREYLIIDTLESCIKQDYALLEIIVVDDGSTDRGLDLCRSFAKANRSHNIRIISQHNSGACAARNNGLVNARGEYLMFLDSDDLISSSKISEQIQKIRSFDADCCLCDYSLVDENGSVLSVVRNNRKIDDFIRNIVSPSNSAMLMRRDSLPADLIWNIKLSKMQDLDFMLRYLVTARNVVYIPKSLYFYRMHSTGRISDNYFKGMPHIALWSSFVVYTLSSSVSLRRKLFLVSGFSLSTLISLLREYTVRSMPYGLKKFIKYCISRY